MEYEELVEERLTHAVIGAFFEVYNTLGFGFLEHVYVVALERELRDRGHTVAREVAVRIMYKNEHLSTQRLDMIIDDRLVVETKSTHQLHSAAIRQLFNYLKGTQSRGRTAPSLWPRAKILPTDSKKRTKECT